MTLSEAEIRRLAFIRYLYNKAVYESQQPEPLAASSVLSFHDAVELFLELSGVHFDAGASGIKFMEYFAILEPKLPP